MNLLTGASLLALAKSIYYPAPFGEKTLNVVLLFALDRARKRALRSEDFVI